MTNPHKSNCDNKRVFKRKLHETVADIKQDNPLLDEIADNWHICDTEGRECVYEYIVKDGVRYMPCKLEEGNKAAIRAYVEKEKTAAEVALARKILAISGGHHKARGFTQAKRLKLLTDKMNEIIPDEVGIVEDNLTSPKEQQ